MNIKTIRMDISGMTCDHCARTIEKLFEGKEGVVEKKVSFADGSGKFVYDTDLLKVENIIETIHSSRHYHVKEVKEVQENNLTSDHLVIIGGGSAAFAASIKAVELGAKVTMINEGLIGGTCVNIGCEPSKAMIRAAEAYFQDNRFEGIEGHSTLIDYRQVVSQKQALVDTLRQKKYIDILNSYLAITLINGRAKLTNSQSLSVNGQTIHFEKLLLATGSFPYIADIPGLRDAQALDSTSALALTSLPKSLIVLGGRYIAVELSQMFARMGTKVTVLQRSKNLIPTEDEDISETLKNYLEQEGMIIHTGVTVKSVKRSSEGITIQALIDGQISELHSEEILAATGRKANSQNLGLEQVGIKITRDGSVKVGETLETTVSGIFAAGDLIGEPAFVYTAAYEGALAAENALTGVNKERNYQPLPWVIFSNPQVAGVGLNEKEAFLSGIEVDVAKLDMINVPRALTAQDTRGFVKLIRKKGTDELVGARILAPEGSEQIMEVTLAIKYKLPVSELATQFHPYLTQSEAIKLCAQTFEKDVSKLSCCS